MEVSEHNYGNFFSFWDVLFGTHVNTFKAPERQGVEGLSMPTLWSQFRTPLTMMWRIIRRAEPGRSIGSEIVVQRITARTQPGS